MTLGIREIKKREAKTEEAVNDAKSGIKFYLLKSLMSGIFRNFKSFSCGNFPKMLNIFFQVSTSGEDFFFRFTIVSR